MLAASVTGCGADSSTAPPGPEKPATPNDVHLQSDAGDYIGVGKTYSYDQSDAVMTVTASGGYLTVSIDGDQRWQGQFQSPSGMTQLKAGTYPNLQRYPYHDPAVGGLSWDGEGRGCNTLSGSFTIDSVTYATDVLTKIDLSFHRGVARNGALGDRRHYGTARTCEPPSGRIVAPDSRFHPGRRAVRLPRERCGGLHRTGFDLQLHTTELDHKHHRDGRTHIGRRWRIGRRLPDDEQHQGNSSRILSRPPPLSI
jgi:hypothetical protein